MFRRAMGKWFLVAAMLPAMSTSMFADDKSKEIQKIQDDRKNRDDAPALGALAPNFKLKTADGKSEIELTALRGKRPVILVFGSYT